MNRAVAWRILPRLPHRRDTHVLLHAGLSLQACEHPRACQAHLPCEHPSNVSSSETPGSTALLLCLAKSFDAGIFIT